MIAIEIDGDVRILDRLDRAIEAVGHARPAMVDIGAVMLKEISFNFLEEGARLNPDRWQALTPGTIADRARQGYPPRPILVRSGDLRNSFMDDVADTEVRVFSGSEKFTYHQQGSENLPRRRMLAFSERMKQEIIAAFVNFINDAIGWGRR